MNKYTKIPQKLQDRNLSLYHQSKAISKKKMLNNPNEKVLSTILFDDYYIVDIIETSKNNTRPIEKTFYLKLKTNDIKISDIYHSPDEDEIYLFDTFDDNLKPHLSEEYWDRYYLLVMPVDRRKKPRIITTCLVTEEYYNYVKQYNSDLKVVSNV